MSDITTWLERLDLGKYADVFAEHEIDFKVLPQLTEIDIREPGLPLGPRRKLLTAIAALKSSSDSNVVNPSSDPEITLSKPHPGSQPNVVS
jgi:hypothetical protein